jgi:hypothetical protein
VSEIAEKSGFYGLIKFLLFASAGTGGAISMTTCVLSVAQIKQGW